MMDALRHKGKEKREVLPYCLLLFSLGIGAFLRFYKIGSQSLWLDEACSYWFSDRTMLDLWTLVPRFETNPPFYYTILKIWRSLFGSSEAGLRSLSAVASIGCIPLIFMVGRLIGKSRAGNWLGGMAALMFALSPLHIQYAQEARPFAMLTFGAILVLYMFLWIFGHSAEACEPTVKNPVELQQALTGESRRPRLVPWMVAAIAVPFTLWLHNTAVLYVFTLVLIALAWFIFRLKWNKAFLTRAIIFGGIAFLLWAPYLTFLVQQAVHAKFMIPRPTVASTIENLVLLFLGRWVSWTVSVPSVLKIVAFGSLVVLATAGLLNIRRRFDAYASVLILGAVLGPILMELVYSFMFTPIFLTRTLIYVSVPFYVAVAAGIMTLRGSGKRALVITAISLIFLNWTHAYYEEGQKEPWGRIVQTVSEQTRKAVVLLVPNYIEIPFSYYTDRLKNGSLHVVPLPFSVRSVLHPGPGLSYQGADPARSLLITPSDIPAIAEAAARESPVWLITRGGDFFDRDGIVFQALMEKKDLVSKADFRGGIRVCRFNERAGE